jgi:CPA1 family monovalent cation:H+ antiporter
MTQMTIILEMLATIAVLSLVSRRLRLPLPILLVITGTILGFVPHLPKMNLEPDLVFFIFLPPLLYIQSCLTSWRDLKANAEPISFLAIGLVLVTQYSVAVVAHQIIPGMSMAVAFVLGAIVSPTDAVAATSIAQGLGVPRSVVNIVEGESLINDASGLVIYRLAVLAILTGTFSMSHLLSEFVYMSIGGIAIGLAMGWLMAKLRYRLNDTPVEITISLLTPYLVYLPTEYFHVSGILAVVTAGLYLGWHAPNMMNSTTRVQWLANWSTITFLLNGMLFLLIGLQLSNILAGLREYSWEQLVGWALAVSAATIITRLLWTVVGGYVRTFIDKKERRQIVPWRQRLLIGWAGMRGVVSLAAALALPLALPTGAEFPFRDLLIFLTFGVILATLVFQGLSLPFVIRFLGVIDDGKLEREETAARIKMARAAIARLEELTVSHEVTMNVESVEHLRDYYRSRIMRYTSHYYDMPHAEQDHAALTLQSLELELVRTERKMVIEMRNRGIISDEILHRLEHELDLTETRLSPQGH